MLKGHEVRVDGRYRAGLPDLAMIDMFTKIIKLEQMMNPSCMRTGP